MEYPTYNFEHDDIHFAALVNHQMINSIIEYIIYITPIVLPILQHFSIFYAALYASLYSIRYINKYTAASSALKWSWSLLTPGQQYVELAYIFSCLLVFALFLYVAINMLRRLERHLQQLKEERKELQEQIEELEKENNEMKATFRLMVSYADPAIMERKRVKQIKN